VNSTLTSTVDGVSSKLMILANGMSNVYNNNTVTHHVRS